MAPNNRQITRIDIIVFVFLALLFVVWLCTGRQEWLRYLYLGLAFLYIFVVRIVAYNLCKKKEEARFDEDNKE